MQAAFSLQTFYQVFFFFFKVSFGQTIYGLFIALRHCETISSQFSLLPECAKLNPNNLKMTRKSFYGFTAQQTNKNFMVRHVSLKSQRVSEGISLWLL